MPDHPIIEPAPCKTWRTHLVLLALAASVLVRLSLMAAGQWAFDDPDNYLPLARAVADGQGLSLNGRPTAYRPPLYPLALAPIVRVFGDRYAWGVAGLHLMLGAATVACTAICASRWGAGRGNVALAAWIVAVDPVLAWQARSVMTETLSAAIVAALLAVLTIPGRTGNLLGGALLGLAGLTRPSLLAAALLTLLAVLLLGTGSARQRFLNCLTMTIALLAVLAPWAIRNTRIFGEPVWTTTHGGYTLALANNEVYYRDVLMGPRGSVWTGHDQWLWWDSVNRATAGLSEPQADRFLRDGAVRLALNRPSQFGTSIVDRLTRFWSPAPAQAVYRPVVRMVTAAWTVPLWIALIAGLVRKGLWSLPQIHAPIQLVGLTLVHSLYWTDLRMRAPIVPAIALIAATAFWRVGRDRPVADPIQDARTFSSSED